MVKLAKGEYVFLSQSGHKHFEYPTQEKESLLYDVDAETCTWVGGGEFKAVIIPENAVFALGNPDKKIPVWVAKHHSS